ncbi:uncharacterized protein HaLaN_11231 [Haematococcus lacustris]|uniref:Uncharacterized protein n=1 Tax=Haematococcus lacustris TaxID=44745 RepID=A0A699YZS0_HAELA|nr:uncharacterized protein HaLaN_11231 [Haematococcus lacustris]
MSAATLVLDQVLAACCSWQHVRDVVAAVRALLGQLLGLLPSSGPLDRYAGGVFTVLQRCVEVLGISLDPAALQRLLALGSAGLLAPDWQMRLAAVEAVTGIIAALQVADPLADQDGLCTILVVTPALTALLQCKAQLIGSLVALRHDSVACTPFS